MEVLQSSLMRTDTSAEAFDLPAYGELLMLYGVATDLATSLNFTSYRNNTRVQAFAFGDRVELRSTDTSFSEDVDLLRRMLES